MANLKDIQYAMNGETQTSVVKDNKAASGIVTYDPEKGIAKNDNKEWYIFKLVDNTKSGGVYIPNVDDAWNPKTKQVERIRLLTGVPTIWQSEQKDLTPEYIRQNMRSIEFPRGVKIRRVAAHDTTMLEFMRLCNSNIGNKKRVKSSRFEFYEYDSAAAEREAFEKEELEFKMEKLAREAEPKAMRRHAAFLGIRLINDLGEPKTDDGVRREYARYAKNNPAYFEQTINSKEIDISWMVRKALSETMIDVGKEQGKAFWAKNGGMICAMPQGVNAQEYLTELALTNSEDGLRFKEQLLSFVKE